MSFLHRYESPITDEGDPDLVGPDEWNDTHTINPRRGSPFFEECYYLGSTGYAGGVDTFVNGTAAAAGDGFSETTDPGYAGPGTGVSHPGIVTLATGTTTTGRALFGSSQNFATGKVYIEGGSVRFGTCLRVDAASNGTDTYTMRCGFNQSATGNSSDAVFFRYTHATNSGKWECVSRSGGSETAIDGGVGPALLTTSDAYQTLEFELNAAADELEFFIDGSSVGTISTNIPTNQLLSFMPNQIVKSAGTTSRQIYVDAYWYEFGLNR